MKFRLKNVSGSKKLPLISKDIKLVEQSDLGDTWEIEINSLEELMQLQEDVYDSIIINNSEGTPVITIHDTWMY